MARKAAGHQTSLAARRMSRWGRPTPPTRPCNRAIARTAFPIAVVVASAGGLEAFKLLLGALPAQTGMGFILIPHLDPARKSHMAELLAPVSAMPVATAVSGRRIRPNHVYVIPPNRLLALKAGRIALIPLPDPRAGRMALDVALRSLAEDQGPNAIGIVLSGTGSHGAAGLGEILKSGGLGLAQDPATALYDQMPRSAAAAGVLPCHVLAPDRMSAVLLAHARQLAQPAAGPDAAPSPSAPFFHDPEALDAAANEVLRSLADPATEAYPVRVWVPECGAGEEAYSIAMLLLERLEAAGKDPALKIFATDCDAQALRAGRRGIYPESIAGTVSRERLARFFHLLPTRQYQVWSELRRTVVFGQVDLYTDPPISKLDLLVCRAELGNLRREALGSLISRLHFALKPGGHLLLGRTVPAVAASGLFETVSEKASLYRNNGSPHRWYGRAVHDGGAASLRDLSTNRALQEEILHIAALEQHRIGQELHDGTQQELTGLGLLAQNLADELHERGAAEADPAKRLAAGIAEANRHVRALARGLVPAPVDAETLPDALGDLARSTRETYKLSCRCDCSRPLGIADPGTATHLYRIAQEAVSNAAKHAKADDILITLAARGDRLQLEICDNGIGIPPQPAVTEGVGLRLMERRCTAIGGRFRIGPRPGGGTIVSCSVPSSAGRP